MYSQQRKSPSERRTALTPCLRTNGRFWQCTCILVFLLIIYNGLLASSEPLVNTKWGLIRGKWSKSLRNRIVANFLGIPYALPPVDDLRFKSPQRWNRTWTAVRDAMIDGQSCVQVDNHNEVVGNEDCLFLNIFVPYTSINQHGSAKLPVLVFVHPGAYMTGSSNSKLFAPDYLMDQNIILVTLNYRLNILGFFSTANQVSPGNYGIKDIKMALEWVQENIHSFGGNPKSVTLLGQSSGSAATHLLAITNKTEGLFHRYILSSGSTLSSWSNHPRKMYRQVCLEVARLLDCLPQRNDNMTTSKEIEKLEGKDDTMHNSEVYNVENDKEMMKCMRKIDVRKMVKMIKYFTVWRRNPLCIFGPTLEDDSEDAILTKDPLNTIKNGLFRNIPAMMQVVKDEGLMKMLDPDAEKELIENFEEYLPYLMEYNEYVSNTSIFAAAIEEFYFNGNTSLGLIHNITNVLSDGVIIWPMFQALQYQSKMGNSSIYFSFFAYHGTFTHTFALDMPVHRGVSHGDNINYLFPVLNNKYYDFTLHNTEDDIYMINIMTEICANFMYDGVPRAWLIPEWPDYRDYHQFMRFGIGKSPDIVVQTDFLSDRMYFWEKLMANISVESVERNIFVGELLKNVSPDSADIMYTCRLIIYGILIIYTYLN